MAARVVVPKDYRFGTNRPWTPAAKRLNPPGKKRRKVFVEPLAPEDWSVLKGDTVSDSLRRLHKKSQECEFSLHICVNSDGSTWLGPVLISGEVF